MTEYHKIQSVFLRDPDTKFKTFLDGQWSTPEFAYLQNCYWDATEKVDGTNVRIYWDHKEQKVTFNGRTKDAQMPTFLYSKLSELFTVDKLALAFPSGDIALYGEGYGAKIQKGGGDYISDGCGFILFDVWCGMWLKRMDVAEIAHMLGVPVVPHLASWTLLEAIAICREGFKSQLKDSAPEGLVLRPKTELLTRRGERVITKIKLKDFTTPPTTKEG